MFGGCPKENGGFNHISRSSQWIKLKIWAVLVCKELWRFACAGVEVSYEGVRPNWTKIRQESECTARQYVFGIVCTHVLYIYILCSKFQLDSLSASGDAWDRFNTVFFLLWDNPCTYSKLPVGRNSRKRQTCLGFETVDLRIFPSRSQIRNQDLEIVV